MLWLYILLGILLAIFLLLLVPVSITIKYENDLLCKLRIGFVPITIYPPKPKKEKKEEIIMNKVILNLRSTARLYLAIAVD